MPYLGQPEIKNFGVPAVGYEDVRGLDVAMHNAFGVRGVERIGDINGKRHQQFEIEWAITD